MTDTTDIVQRLRVGIDVWRVADPETGAYCMEFSHSEYINPERSANEWLENHKRAWPESMHANKVVARVVVRDTWKAEAADTIESQAARIAELERQNKSQRDEWLSWDEKRAGLEKDAARYRWLRVNAREQWQICHDDFGRDLLQDDSLDAAIDAAMKD